MDRHLNDRLEEQNRKTLDAQIDHTRPPSSTPTPNCTHWLTGHCFKGKTCPFFHDPPMKGKDAAPAAPASVPPPPSGAESSATGGGKAAPASGGQEKGGKGKAKKGKGKGKVPIDNPRNLCANFQTGMCTRTSCPYVHEIGTPVEQKELEKLRTIMANARSRTNSPAAGVKICFAYRNTGYCPHGDQCAYSHDLGTDNGKGKAKGKGKSKKGKE